MKFNFRFSNLLGTVYRRGNLLFTPDGSSVISPVGNRLTIFDLKNHKSETLGIESHMNITCVALAPDGITLIIVNQDGEAYLCSLISHSVVRTYHFHRPIRSIKFSPNGKKFAVTRDNMIQMFRTPGRSLQFNPFDLERTYYGAYDETTCIDWTTDSRVFCAGSKDMSTHVYGAEYFKNLVIYTLGGHGQTVIAVFFEENSLNLYSLARNGQLIIWECDVALDELEPYEPEADNVEKDDDEEESITNEKDEQQKEQAKQKEMEEKAKTKIHYRRLAKYSFKDARGEGMSGSMTLTSADFHKSSHILVTGFHDGCFFLHDMPDFNLIHSLQISDTSLTSVVFNKTGDWISLGCSGMGQLLVWEWQSESYILKQQGHFNTMNCLCYSPDGQYIVTGGDDGKVKVWNTSSGFCFVTFTEHLAGITGVAFTQNGQVVVSASLDGTVRAFDLNRYRNFRTFTSPHPAQFSCLALDSSGELVCAAGQDVFEIFVWSMQTGRLLEILAGHEGPISCLCFSPSHAVLASASWDKSVKLWDVFANKGARETMDFRSDVLALCYRPDGNELAVATLDAQITFWNPHNVSQTGCIEGRPDLGYFRKDGDKIKAKTSTFGKAFNTICYTADGQCLLAAGRSKNVCIYSVTDQILMKKFEISCNVSFDGMEEYLDKRKMTEWGNLSLVDDSTGKAVSLPGVRKGDMSSRHWKPEVRVSTVQFSPTGRAWAATTTEGLLIYSLDHNLVFDPFELEIDITPASVKSTLFKREYSSALMLSFRLNEQALIQQVIESIPASDIELISHSLADVYVDKLLGFLATQIESSAHIELYLSWVLKLLIGHGPKLKQRSQSALAILRILQKNVTQKFNDLRKICDHNKYSIQYLISLSKTKRKAMDNDKDDGHADDSDKDKDSTDIVQSSSDDEGSIDFMVS